MRVNIPFWVFDRDQGETLRTDIDIRGAAQLIEVAAPKDSSVTRTVQEPNGFQRVHLVPGETKTFSFPITHESSQFYDMKMRRIVEPGSIRIMVGGNSQQTAAAKLEVAE